MHLSSPPIILANANHMAQKNAELTTTLFRQLSESRQANEELQNRFAALEAFIDRHGLQPFELAFINPPIDDDTEPNVLATASGARISQILPVASVGVSAIALHIAKAAPRSDAILNVRSARSKTAARLKAGPCPWPRSMPAG